MPQTRPNKVALVAFLVLAAAAFALVTLAAGWNRG